MIKPPKHPNESERLKALFRYKILDTLSEQAYDDITRVASYICGTQMAVIGLIDQDRQWYKSSVGVAEKEAARDLTFCAHAILKDEVMVVPDATLDRRFHDHPAVTGGPQVKFYAGAPLKTEDGHVLGTLCVFDSNPKVITQPQFEILQALSRQVMNLLELRLNVSALAEVAADLEKAKEASVELAKSKGEFLANMSHEIRTPMNGILGMTDLLLRTALNQEQKEYSENIDLSAKSLLTLINDILDFSKIEAGKLDIEKTDFSLSDLLFEVEKVFRMQAQQKNLLLEIRNQSPHNILNGDVARIRQILINLIGNALKFTEKGSVKVHVQMTSPGLYRFEVTDTGIGIPASALSKLFQDFSQVDTSTTRKYGGTGLGLSICLRLAKLMDGKIGANSHTGKGSMFWFELNLGSGQAQNLPAEPKKITQAVKPEVARNYRILVAEDNAVNKVIISKVLEQMGYQTQIVSNGIEALSAMEKNHFDLILMDCHMSQMDGYEATAKIRSLKDQAKRNIPIIALTAGAMKGDSEKCIESGMDDYVSKPFSREQLEEKIMNWLGLKAS